MQRMTLSIIFLLNDNRQCDFFFSKGGGDGRIGERVTTGRFLAHWNQGESKGY